MQARPLPGPRRNGSLPVRLISVVDQAKARLPIRRNDRMHGFFYRCFGGGSAPDATPADAVYRLRICTIRTCTIRIFTIGIGSPTLVVIVF